MSLFDMCGEAEYAGEAISLSEHAVQTAQAAEAAGEPVDVQVACLLHDVGHLLGVESGRPFGMGEYGTVNHEGVGAEFLAALGFPSIASYVSQHHVSAKRYLCATKEGYHDMLSHASKQTLIHQGGPMSQEEVVAFEADERSQLAMRLRGYDEAGKDPDAPELTPAHYSDALREILAASISAQLGGGSGDRAAKGTGTGTGGGISEHVDTYVVSAEQKLAWEEDGLLVLRNAWSEEQIAALPRLATEAAHDTLEPTAAASVGAPYVELAESICTQLTGAPAVLVNMKLLSDSSSGSLLSERELDTAEGRSSISVAIAIDPGTSEAAASLSSSTMGDVLVFDVPRRHSSGYQHSHIWRSAACLTFKSAVS